MEKRNIIFETLKKYALIVVLSLLLSFYLVHCFILFRVKIAFSIFFHNDALGKLAQPVLKLDMKMTFKQFKPNYRLLKLGKTKHEMKRAYFHLLLNELS